MTDNPSREIRTFLVDRPPSPARSAEEMPIVPPGAERSLRAFLERASLARNDWHTMPDYALALRLVSCNASADTIIFELRESNQSTTARRFCYDARSQTISSPSTKPAKHPELVAHRELPSDPDKLARVIATLVHDDPTFLLLLESGVPTGRVRGASTPTQPLDPHRAGPVSYAVSDILRHLTAHWFGGRHVNWDFWPRFACALFGSVVVLAAQGIVYSVRFPAWFSAELRPFQPRRDDLALFAAPEFAIGTLVVLSLSFAGITSVINHQHGPVRLFLGGFFLPYLVLSLLTWLNTGG